MNNGQWVKFLSISLVTGITNSLLRPLAFEVERAAVGKAVPNINDKKSH